MTTFKFRLEEQMPGSGMDSSDTTYDQVACFCEHGNEPSDSINVRKFTDCLSTECLLASQE
jgi:hypothetical protein